MYSLLPSTFAQYIRLERIGNQPVPEQLNLVSNGDILDQKSSKPMSLSLEPTQHHHATPLVI